MIVQINANVRTLGFVCLMSVAGTMSAVAAPAAAIYGPNLESFAYPHPVQWFDFESQGMRLQMAYMDVAPGDPQRTHRGAACTARILRRRLGKA